MRLISLEMEAFGSFPDKETIDFQAMGNSGLFLITGETGSGKTTILDAVTFALFGKGSGSRREEKEFHSDHARDKIPYVELVFEKGGKTYTVRRSPPYHKMQKSGKTNSTASQENILYYDDKVLKKKEEVDTKIREILCMDVNQWRQIVMLAQGEFLRILDIKTDDRSKLFRELFNTDIYKTITDRLEQRYKDLENDNKVDGRSFRDALGRFIITDPELSDSVKDADLPSFKDIREDIEGYIGSEKEEATVLSERIGSLTSDIMDLNGRIKAIEDVNNLFNTLEKEKSRLDAILSKKDAIESDRKRLDDNARCQKVIPFKKEVDRLKATCDSLSARISEMTSVVADATEKASNANKECGKIPDMEDRSKELSVSIDTLNKMIPQYNILSSKMSELSGMEKKHSELASGSEKLDAVLNGLKNEKQDLEEFINAHDGDEVTLAEKKNELSVLEQRKKDIEFLKKNVIELKGLLSSKERMTKDLVSANERFALSSNRFTEANKAFLLGQSVILAKDLVDGMPCPVCGSTSHPSPAVSDLHVPSQKEVEDLKIIMEKDCTAYNKVESECKEISGKIDAISKNVESRKKELGLDDIDVGYETCNSSIKQISKEISDLNTICSHLLDKKERLSKNNKDIERNVLNKDALQTELNRSDTDIALIEKDIEGIHSKLDPKYPDETSLSHKIEELRSEMDHIDKCIKNIRSVKESTEKDLAIAESTKNEYCRNLDDSMGELGVAEGSYQKALAENDLSDDQLGTLTLSETRVDILNRNISEYNNSVSACEGSIKALESSLVGKQREDAGDLDTELSRMQSEKNQLEERHKILDYSIRTNTSVLEGLSKLYEKHGEKEKILSTYREMVVTAKGDISGNRISFEEYVQCAYMDMILESANTFLKKMTIGRYELKRTSSVSSGRSRAALDAVIFDNETQKSRSITTPSGGESFLIALSMALGLSQVVQATTGAMDVNVLFIDEGFGSLDPESLENVREALSNISKDVLVGIISHVDALEEWTDRKIIVTKKGSGSSIRTLHP